MKIKNLNLDNIKENKVYKYIDESNQEIMVAEIENNIIESDMGYYLITGEIKFNDSTIYPAIFGISSDDSGEMFEYHILTEKGWFSSSDDVSNLLGKKKSEIFPFTYHLNYAVSGDIHTDEQY